MFRATELEKISDEFHISRKYPHPHQKGYHDLQRRDLECGVMGVTTLQKFPMRGMDKHFDRGRMEV